MAEYQSKFEKQGGYAFDRGAIGDLWQAAREFIGKDPEVSINFDRDHTVQMTNVDALLGDDLVKSNYIRRLVIEASDYAGGRSSRITIELHRSTPSLSASSVSVALSGDRVPCMTARTKIENIVEGNRLWYSRFMLPDHPAVYATLGILSMLVPLALVLGASTFVSSQALAWVLGLVLWIGVLGAWYSRSKFFPRLVFDVGKSAKIGQSAHYWRNTIGVGLMLAIAAGVISILIVEHWHK